MAIPLVSTSTATERERERERERESWPRLSYLFYLFYFKIIIEKCNVTLVPSGRAQSITNVTLPLLTAAVGKLPDSFLIFILF